MLGNVFALLGLALIAPKAKIDGELQKALITNKVADVTVMFEHPKSVIEHVNSLKFASLTDKTITLKDQLEKHTKITQISAINLLEGLGISFNSLWITNSLFINGADTNLIQQLSIIPEVKQIRQQITIPLEPPIPASSDVIKNQWGIEKIEAPSVWATGNHGENVCVSTVDSGVLHTHEALRNNFRGFYAWFDPYNLTSTPWDSSGHGTHTMGTIVGTNGIGVAPNATWISCLGCLFGSCSEYALCYCGQFICCPTLWDGTKSDCTLRPKVVSNSWGGGQGTTFFDSVIACWLSVSIVPLFSQGNSGPNCGTANSPADHPYVIAVGSTDATDSISSFSSRGPSKREGLKPNVCAPGSNVRSSWYTSDNSYETLSGTSMACPHAAGTAALILSKHPNLTPAEVKNILQDNADTNSLTKTCGGTDKHDNNFGYGRINARRCVT